MSTPDITCIAPFFIVRHVPDALSFYRDHLGFDITFQGPHPADIFFGIVERGGAMIMLKAVGVDASRGVHFFQPLKNDDDGLRGFEVQDADGYVLFFGRPK